MRSHQQQTPLLPNSANRIPGTTSHTCGSSFQSTVPVLRDASMSVDSGLALHGNYTRGSGECPECPGARAHCVRVSQLCKLNCGLRLDSVGMR